MPPKVLWTWRVFVAWVSPPQRGQDRVLHSRSWGSGLASRIRPSISASERSRALPKILSLSGVGRAFPDSHRDTVAWLVIPLVIGECSGPKAFILCSRAVWLIPRRPASVGKDSRYAFIMKPTWAALTSWWSVLEIMFMERFPTLVCGCMGRPSSIVVVICALILLTLSIGFCTVSSKDVGGVRTCLWGGSVVWRLVE